MNDVICEKNPNLGEEEFKRKFPMKECSGCPFELNEDGLYACTYQLSKACTGGTRE